MQESIVLFERVSERGLERTCESSQNCFDGEKEGEIKIISDVFLFLLPFLHQSKEREKGVNGTNSSHFGTAKAGTFEYVPGYGFQKNVCREGIENQLIYFCTVLTSIRLLNPKPIHPYNPDQTDN